MIYYRSFSYLLLTFLILSSLASVKVLVVFFHFFLHFLFGYQSPSVIAATHVCGQDDQSWRAAFSGSLSVLCRRYNPKRLKLFKPEDLIFIKLPA